MDEDINYENLTFDDLLNLPVIEKQKYSLYWLYLFMEGVALEYFNVHTNKWVLRKKNEIPKYFVLYRRKLEKPISA